MQRPVSSMMILAGLLLAGGALLRVTAQDGSRPASAPSPERGKTSYAPVALEERFPEVLRRLSAEKPQVMQRAMKELELRYDLADRPAQGVEMTRGKPIQEGVRTKLPQGATWQALAAMAPDEVKKRGLFPRGFLPLPHAKHAEGGMVFPAMHIDATKQQSGRDLTRFDVDFDIPEHFLPEFPPAIFLNQRADLGDVSKGQVITQENFFELFDGIITPKQIDGLRLLVTPFPQQQFNLTHDRRSELPSLGVTCFDCHVNGHTNAAFHLAGEARPNAFRPRIDTPTLRGVSVQSVFGSRRALRTVEDFTEFEQRGAYFDGDVVIAVKKGVNILERGSQVHNMAEFQEMLDFPPAPKLDVFGRLDPKQATEQELRGEAVFFGKGRCFECHPAPHYTDGTMHDLQVYRFYEHHFVNDRAITHEGMIKTFPLRGIKESPPYLHDGRLLTLEDTVEFFNLILGTQLTDEEKADLVAFMRVL